MRVEPFRSPLHRLVPFALAALGILGSLLTIFAGLAVLNHSVLPFKGWPLDAERLSTGTQVLARAPVGTGRLRAVPGGAPAATPRLTLAQASPLLRVAPVRTLAPAPRVTIRHRAAHPMPRTPTERPAAAPAPSSPAPAPVSTPSPAPTATPVVSAPAVVAQLPSSASRAPSAATPSSSPGHGNGGGRAHAPGQLKKVAAAAAPAAPAPAAAATPGPPADATGDGNGHGHGPPPWAHGHH